MSDKSNRAQPTTQINPLHSVIALLRTLISQATHIMMTKEQLLQEADKLISQLRDEQTNIFTFIPLPFISSRLEEYTEKCVAFQQQVSTATTDDDLFKYQKDFYTLEREAQRRSVLLNTLPSIGLLYLTCTALFFIFTSADMSSVVEHVLGVKPPERLIALGVFGALIYLATTGLLRIEASGVKTQFNSVLSISIRMSLAVIVPIVLVVLFFNEDGTTKTGNMAPEMISFACGYSAKLVVELFNKIVEKGSKMIQAI